jgi:hypothetical protein
LHELSLGRLSSDLALQILETNCVLEYPDSAAIASKLRVDARRVRTHLDALEKRLDQRRIIVASQTDQPAQSCVFHFMRMK